MLKLKFCKYFPYCCKFDQTAVIVPFYKVSKSEQTLNFVPICSEYQICFKNIFCRDLLGIANVFKHVFMWRFARNTKCNQVLFFFALHQMQSNNQVSMVVFNSKFDCLLL